jgi:type III secretion system (T3SS) SseB-like protein
MNEDLLETLRALRSDPTRAVVLYEQLFRGRYWVLAQKPAEKLENMFFLTYPTRNEKRELPTFTAGNRELLSKLISQATDAVVVEIEGSRMWPRMYDVVKEGNCFVAVDPGEQYGIRLTKEMILGMINMYGTQ